MDDQVVSDVPSTWKVVAGITPQAAALFYNNLFEAAPTLKPLFNKGNMDEQGKKLMQKMIGAAVGKLGDLDTLFRFCKALANATLKLRSPHLACGSSFVRQRDHQRIHETATAW